MEKGCHLQTGGLCESPKPALLLGAGEVLAPTTQGSLYKPEDLGLSWALMGVLRVAAYTCSAGEAETRGLLGFAARPF